jgi:hypothetical protein
VRQADIVAAGMGKLRFVKGDWTVPATLLASATPSAA